MSDERAGNSPRAPALTEAQLRDAERRLMSRVRKRGLKESLGLIQQAEKHLWPPHASLIIQGFPDHGPDHSRRVAYYADQLLSDSVLKTLCSEEMFLLLAGIYLHDIGMQCPVAEEQDIRGRAEKLGAAFGKAFAKHSAPAYSPEEQNAIRKNHHYLSGAWIACAKRAGVGELGAALEKIQGELVDDLVDVCMYHSKLAIDGCPSACTYRCVHKPGGRKRFVAALVRFADELDIAANRVNLEAEGLDQLDPSDAMYFHLHHHTDVTFPKPGAVQVTIWLHPDDLRDYRRVIEIVYFEGSFVNKNKPVLEALEPHSARPEVDEVVLPSNGEKVLPEKISKALQARASGNDRSLARGS